MEGHSRSALRTERASADSNWTAVFGLSRLGHFLYRRPAFGPELRRYNTAQLEESEGFRLVEELGSIIFMVQPALAVEASDASFAIGRLPMDCSPARQMRSIWRSLDAGANRNFMRYAKNATGCKIPHPD